MRLLICLTLLLTGCISKPDNTRVIESLKSEVTQTVKSSIVPSVSTDHTLIYSYAGVGLFVLGALVSAFLNKQNGLVLILCGIASGAVPYVVTSSYFAWISAGTLVCVSCIGIWYLRWKAIHEANEEEEKDKS
jgi:hypothetical protein